MSVDSNFIEKGVSYANEAIRFDKAACNSAGDSELYEKALSNYMRAIEYYKAATKFEKNPRTKEVLHGKIKEYLARAEKLKGWIETNANKQQQAVRNKGGGASGATASKQRAKSSGASASNKASHGNDSQGVSDGNVASDDDIEIEDEETKKLRLALESAIVTEKPNIKWDDVAGLEGAKSALKEAVILPKKFPQMFVGKRKPWKGILLYGPPGTGKSFLAKAVATESDSYFFSVSSSDLVSKWQGESEKLVNQLFVMARQKGNSIVFIDEIDSLVSTRSDTESESSRRIKTEFLVQMDGVGSNSDGVLVLGATNIPWGLDDALLRRMERRIYIPLPDRIARARMFRLHLGDTPNTLAQEDFDYLAQISDGYSGSDLKTVARDAIMSPVRLSTQATHFKKIKIDGKTGWTPCSPGDPGAVEKDLMSIASEELHMPPVTRENFEQALQSSKPSVGHDNLSKHEEFTREKGQEGR